MNQIMEFRKAKEADLSLIMNIIEDAKVRLKKKGIDQWQNGYPNVESIRLDIEQGYSYVFCQDKKVIGAVALSFDGEETYQRIYEGQWIQTDHYGVIHRLAVDPKLKGNGIGARIIACIEKECTIRGVHSIKVDTHGENLAMRRLLEQSGFVYCGIIYLHDQSKRVAYEKASFSKEIE